MPAKLRVVLDTNVVISGLISPKGPPAGILKALKAGRFVLLTSQAINEEILEVMDRPRLRDRYGLADHMFDIAFILWEQAEVITKLPPVKASKDSDDDKFLAAALGGLAHYLVTGDSKDLLSLGECQGIRIVSPRQFLTILHP
ncbi:MAG: putative toxin-antitoxin system toxin component, PIN family [Elusimicrobia bacterium]|nr:putative toxin-antitoxin system toxin component, PIN family [Elusimicrobiota bacterium]